MTPEVEAEIDKIGYRSALGRAHFYVVTLTARLTPYSTRNPRSANDRRFFAEHFLKCRDKVQELRSLMAGLDQATILSINLTMTPVDQRDADIPNHLFELDQRLALLAESFEFESDLQVGPGERALKLPPGPSRDEHAYRVAEALAEIYYIAHGAPPGAGHNCGEPSGPFGRCVKSVFQQLGIKKNWRRPAQSARDSLAEKCANLNRVRSFELPSISIFDLSKGIP